MRTLLIILVSILLFSCATEKKILETDVKKIVFGSGGGFTGEVTTYTLTSNSKILKGKNEINQINSNQTLEYFKTANGLKDYTFFKPGNIYQFIEIQSKDTSNRITWSPSSKTEIDPSVIEFYDRLMTLTKPKNHVE